MTLTSTIELAIEYDRCRDVLSTPDSREYVAKYRMIAVDTIIKLMDMYGSNYETVAHAISLFDRFLVACLEIGQDNEFEGHLLGHACACFLLAMKLREVSCPALTDITPRGWSAETIQSCETQILCLLNWSVHSTTGNAIFQES